MADYINKFFLRMITEDILNYEGAETRLTFFLFHVNCLVILSVISLIEMLLTKLFPGLHYLFYILMWLCSIVLFAASLSLAVRRLHDMRFSGIFAVLMFIPIVNIIFFIVLLIYPGRTWEAGI